MSAIIRVLAKRRFNFIDSQSIVWGAILIASGRVLTGLALVISLGVVSVIVERMAKAVSA